MVRTRPRPAGRGEPRRHEGSRMNRALPPGDCGNRNAVAGRPSRCGGTMPGAGRLVGRVAAPARYGWRGGGSAGIAHVAPRLAHVSARRGTWRYWPTTGQVGPQSKKARRGRSRAGRKGNRLLLLGVDTVGALPALGFERFDGVSGLLHRASHKAPDRVFQPAVLRRSSHRSLVSA